VGETAWVWWTKWASNKILLTCPRDVLQALIDSLILLLPGLYQYRLLGVAILKNWQTGTKMY